MPVRYAALITAAGRSRRMGDGLKKEYGDLQGVPVLAHAVRPFVLSSEFSRILISVPPGDLDRARSLLSPHVDAESIGMIEGGETRQQSVFLGLKALASDPPLAVLIHDGARPWISLEIIERVLEAAVRSGACVPLVESAEAVKLVEGSGAISRHFPRGAVKVAQTPQGFHFREILAAHEKAARDGFICVDDAEIYARYQGAVAWVAGDVANRKLTYPHDWEAG
jgi:2-C-methyl-D-erythritol 4-phosphate cytidylyltransferase